MLAIVVQTERNTRIADAMRSLHVRVVHLVRPPSFLPLPIFVLVTPSDRFQTSSTPHEIFGVCRRRWRSFECRGLVRRRHESLRPLHGCPSKVFSFSISRQTGHAAVAGVSRASVPMGVSTEVADKGSKESVSPHSPPVLVLPYRCHDEAGSDGAEPDEKLLDTIAMQHSTQVLGQVACVLSARHLHATFVCRKRKNQS